MKCIKHILTNEIVRVTNEKAEEMIASDPLRPCVYVYVPKSEWEEAAQVTKFTKPVCSTCGSDDIVVDAYARWNPVTQQFELERDTSTTFLCGSVEVKPPSGTFHSQAENCNRPNEGS
jgi:hypothetical protein